jgi:Domain of unknown function (DUF4189)
MNKIIFRTSAIAGTAAFVVASFALTVLFSAAPAAAQTYVCPSGPGPGERQVGTTGGGGGLAPVPVCVSDTGGSAPAPSGPVWLKRWGAVAVDGSTSKFGVSEGNSSKGGARKAAVRQCKANGGGKGCKSLGEWQNGCGALAWGDSRYNAVSGPDRDAVINRALASCGKSTTNCAVYYAGCSYAVQAQ